MNEPGLDYELAFEPHPEYLRVIISGSEMNVAIARDYNRRIADECARLGLNRILIERNFPVTLDIVTSYQISDELMKVLRGKRIAYVNPHRNLDEDLDFSVMVGTNRGSDSKLFSDASEAERWLVR